MARLAAALLDSGAEAEASTKDLVLQNTVVQPGGQTALHLAARSNEADIVDLLLCRGASLAAVDFNGHTPAVAAVLLGRKVLAQRLATASGESLPDAGAREALKREAVADGKQRVAAALEVPAAMRTPYTLPAAWSVEECERVLLHVRAAAGQNSQGNGQGWTTARHRAYATTDVPVSSVAAVDEWVRASLVQRLLPRMAAKAGLEGLVFRDLFFVFYSAAGQRELVLHRDGGCLSFNILLNDPGDFDGGGTYVEADDETHRIGRGDCFVHAAKLRHAGVEVTRGKRYLLVGFLDAAEDGHSAASGGQTRSDAPDMPPLPLLLPPPPLP